LLLYLHIPFCDSKCHYCAFNSFTSNHHLKKRYIQALCKQLRHDLEHTDTRWLHSLYIGGGTPSTIDPRLYEPIFKLLVPLITPHTEITMEANPNSAKAEWLQGVKALGVNRISFGVQSFDDTKLSFLGRAHSAREAIQAIENAARVGFERINIDLIYDTALDTKELLRSDIQLAINLPIDHISTYALILEEGTPFANKREYKKDDEDLGYFIKDLIPFEHYEVSNFGQTPSRHNLGYWRLEEYLGVGCGAVGYKDGQRSYPPQDLKTYLQNPLKKEIELLSPHDLRLEKIFLGLRSCVGVPKSLVDPQKAQILLEEHRLYERGERLYNPNYFLADELALFLS